MKLLNKEKRLKYIGFNDIWFVVFGIIILSFVTDYLFNNSFARFPFWEAIVHWSISFGFSVTNWFVMRFNFIFLRKKFTKVEDVGKRALLLFLSIVVTVTLIDALGGIIIGYIYNQTYYFLLYDKKLYLQNQFPLERYFSNTYTLQPPLETQKEPARREMY